MTSWSFIYVHAGLQLLLLPARLSTEKTRRWMSPGTVGLRMLELRTWTWHLGISKSKKILNGECMCRGWNIYMFIAIENKFFTKIYFFYCWYLLYLGLGEQVMLPMTSDLVSSSQVCQKSSGYQWRNDQLPALWPLPFVFLHLPMLSWFLHCLSLCVAVILPLRN